MTKKKLSKAKASSSKASTKSWRTLHREAKMEAEFGLPSRAKELRKQAAMVRSKTSTPLSRSEAMKKSWAARRAKKPDILASIAHDIQFGEPQAATQALREVVSPPIVSALAHDIMSLSRKPGGITQIDMTLNSMAMTARYEGERRAEESFARKSAEEMRGVDEMIVGAFIAEVKAVAAHHGGSIPPDHIFTTSAMTIGKVAEALQRAGYSPAGRNNFNRVSENRERVLGETLSARQSGT